MSTIPLHIRFNDDDHEAYEHWTLNKRCVTQCTMFIKRIPHVYYLAREKMIEHLGRNERDGRFQCLLLFRVLPIVFVCYVSWRTYVCSWFSLMYIVYLRVFLSLSLSAPSFSFRFGCWAFSILIHQYTFVRLFLFLFIFQFFFVSRCCSPVLLLFGIFFLPQFGFWIITN